MTIEQVREFHHAFGVEDASTPSVRTKEVRELRVRLIAEELCELCCALGVDLSLDAIGRNCDYEVKAISDDESVDLVGAADALADLDYVIQGANLAFGLPAQEITNEVHRSNMSKLGADGKPIRRADGKVLKGPAYSPPDIARLLAKEAATQQAANDNMRLAQSIKATSDATVNLGTNTQQLRAKRYAMTTSNTKEAVNHPAHYGGAADPYEAIKVIEAWSLGFCLGNAVKYICRAGKKGVLVEDLKKARWYLDREIARLESSL